MHRQFNIGYFFSVGFIIHKEIEDSSKLWSAIEYKFKKMETSVGRGWVQIQVIEKDRDEALFDTEEIFKLHQSGIQKHSNFYIGVLLEYIFYLKPIMAMHIICIIYFL